jgi:hypothetical protein
MRHAGDVEEFFHDMKKAFFAMRRGIENVQDSLKSMVRPDTLLCVHARVLPHRLKSTISP